MTSSDLRFDPGAYIDALTACGYEIKAVPASVDPTGEGGLYIGFENAGPDGRAEYLEWNRRCHEDPDGTAKVFDEAIKRRLFFPGLEA